MKSRFNFTLARKADSRVRMSRKGAPNQDAIRLTPTTLMVGKNLNKRFKTPENGITVRIEKDADKFALRIIPTDEGTSRDTYRLVHNGDRRTLSTVRPQPLFDMPNGSYLEDLKEPGVYVLEA